MTPFGLSLDLAEAQKFLLEKVQQKITCWLMVKLSTSRKAMFNNSLLSTFNTMSMCGEEITKGFQE
jgi:hypothetical protein